MKKMKNDYIVRFSRGMILALIMVAMLSGCTRSKPSRFYTLRSVIPESDNGDKQLSVNDKKEVLRIINVTVPDYIERNTIVTRVSDSEVELNEYNRWAGNIKLNIKDVIIQDLMKLRPDLDIKNYSMLAGEYNYGLIVRINELIADQTGKVVLNAVFWISSGKDNVSKSSLSITKKVKASNYDAIVSAMSEMLGELSNHIALSLPKR